MEDEYGRMPPHEAIMMELSGAVNDLLNAPGPDGAKYRERYLAIIVKFCAVLKMSRLVSAHIFEAKRELDRQSSRLTGSVAETLVAKTYIDDVVHDFEERLKGYEKQKDNPDNSGPKIEKFVYRDFAEEKP